MCKIHEEKTVNGIFYEGKLKVRGLKLQDRAFCKNKVINKLVSHAWLRLNFIKSSEMFATAVLLFLIRTVASCQKSRCNGTSSLPNARLIGRAFLVQEAKSTGDCIDICDKLSQCRSINFNWVHFLCELNKADVHIAPQSLITSKGFVYLDNPWIKFQLVSCGKVFVESSQTKHFSLNRKIRALFKCYW